MSRIKSYQVYTQNGKHTCIMLCRRFEKGIHRFLIIRGTAKRGWDQMILRVWSTFLYAAWRDGIYDAKIKGSAEFTIHDSIDKDCKIQIGELCRCLMYVCASVNRVDTYSTCVMYACSQYTDMSFYTAVNWYFRANNMQLLNRDRDSQITIDPLCKALDMQLHLPVAEKRQQCAAIHYITSIREAK